MGVAVGVAIGVGVGAAVGVVVGVGVTVGVAVGVAGVVGVGAGVLVPVGMGGVALLQLARAIAMALMATDKRGWRFISFESLLVESGLEAIALADLTARTFRV